MGLLKFTKNYSSSDDGSNLTGAELAQLQADISAVLNGGISNINIATDAAIVESKITFDTSSGHNHDGSNSKTLSSGGYRGFIQGADLEWLSTTTVKAQSGAMDIAGTLYTRNSYATTMDVTNNDHWVEGASQQGTNKWVYVYAYNSSGALWDTKLWLLSPQYADTGSDDSSVKIYRQNASVWYRCIGAIRLNATGSGEIANFYQRDNAIMWDIPISVSTTASGTWTAAIDCSAAIPEISSYGFFGLFSNDTSGNDAGISIRPNGGTWLDLSSDAGLASGIWTQIGGASAAEISGQRLCATDGSQQINSINKVADDNIVINVEGYLLNIR